VPERLRHGVQALWTRRMAGTSTGTHAAFEEMVLAKGLGDADCQAPRDEKGDCGPGAPVSCDHAGSATNQQDGPQRDARGMAQMMRAGIYRPVHVKTLRSQKLRMLPAELSAINPYAVPGFNTDHR
jgi:hypothetical protein